MARVLYEWDREIVDANGDVIDHNHSDKLRVIADDPGRLVLVRDEIDRYEGLVDRYWAYANNGKLPEFFEDERGCEGPKVPKRFHAELAKIKEVAA
jgi:hypothetical protein